MVVRLPHLQLAHYTFDAVLVSAFLAGVKRSTGLTYVSHPPQLSPRPLRRASHSLPAVAHCMQVDRELPVGGGDDDGSERGAYGEQWVL
ncbi:hypothetical protein KC344_g20 [Hortaea werneckii]|nr:hypothetical protein KC344_g20 [Hortaea werneckii]